MNIVKEKLLEKKYSYVHNKSNKNLLHLPHS